MTWDIIPWMRRNIENLPSARDWEFRREFDDLVRRFEDLLPREATQRLFLPAVNVSEDDTHVLVTAEIPGMDPNDLKVELRDNVLTISGEKKEEKEEKGESLHRIERSFGSFSRSVTLPAEVKDEGAEAKFKNGVLSLKMPKVESAKKKSIEIKVES